jgi:hypothetical protein
MTPHAKIYMKHFDYKSDEFIPCEICNNKSVDIHHIHGRGKDKNVIENLMALCRDCHNKIHNTSEYSKFQIQEIHNNFLITNKLYIFR